MCEIPVIGGREPDVCPVSRPEASTKEASVTAGSFFIAISPWKNDSSSETFPVSPNTDRRGDCRAAEKHRQLPFDQEAFQAVFGPFRIISCLTLAAHEMFNYASVTARKRFQRRRPKCQFMP